ncbi:MAG TPA: bifunctional 2-polyprenyl-6-hydroxyphenol methylase/3-demethylubiquinol 3-O-methyltransferase UbiG [Beijerinckiaceae bacterium]|nr:bifunctional 2-polyprenyl-6-hydroxyphenol methylase/3-demethylubiquinol 3-O-methyltransferase UbiG [Beijerinckiaceae bacterium]
MALSAPRATRAASADQAEVDLFERLGDEWWDPKGPMRALHKFNPIRVGWLRDRLVERYPEFEGERRRIDHGRALAGLTILDIGCGAGVLAEPLARLGARVTGIDLAPRTIEVARAHAADAGLSIDYRRQSVEELLASGQKFDAVLAMEVVEHVPDLRGFLAAACALTNEDGMLFAATLNRTLKSYALAIVAAEYVLRWVPRGAHRWEKFVTPEELTRALAASGLSVTAQTGVVFDPFRGAWRAASDMDVNYMVAASRTGSRG